MKHTPSFALGLAACALLTSTLIVMSSDRPSAAQQPAGAVAEDPGADLFGQICGDCHDSNRIVSNRRTKSEWEDVIKKMIGEGASGTEKDFQAVFVYLRRHYGKVFINAATSEEITITLGLSDKDADAVLAYRTAHGAFPDFDAVAKVPGIDVKALEEHKEAIAF